MFPKIKFQLDAIENKIDFKKFCLSSWTSEFCGVWTTGEERCSD